MGKFIDLTGQKFGRLTALKRVEDYITPSGKHHIQWLCECDCEEKNKVVVLGQSLRDGNTKSCGCLQKEIGYIRGKEAKKYNKYDLSGEYGIGYTSKGEEFYFDLDDYDIIKKYCWCIDKAGYVKSSCVDTRKTVFLHRLITDCPDGMVIDHINHITADNRKSNLRICTQHENTMNCKRPTNNSSGVKGVSYYKPYKKWNAFITINGIKKNLGYFEKLDDAKEVRKKAEEQYFGEYAYAD